MSISQGTVEQFLDISTLIISYFTSGFKQGFTYLRYNDKIVVWCSCSEGLGIFGIVFGRGNNNDEIF